MKIYGKSFMLLSIALLLSSVTFAQLTDPYEILNREYDAMGGLDKIKAQKTSYTEGTLDIVGTGLAGTIKIWSGESIKNRQEVDLTVFQQTSGDNGEFAWSVDMNGKLQKVTDSISLVRRELSLRADKFEFLDRNSNIYKVTYEGLKNFGDTVCYGVKIANTLNQDYSIQYFDTTSFLNIKTVTVTPSGQSHSTMSDFRDVDGVINPYRTETIEQPTGMTQVFQITDVKINVDIDPALFEPPETDVQDFEFANGKSAENIKFKYILNHIYFEIEVGGKTRLWVLDTGAGMTVMMPEFVKELGLTTEGNMKGQGAESLVDVSFATMPAFSLPGLTFKEQKAAVIDINSLFREWSGFEIAGILGYDFLSRLVVKIDYANELISFYNPETFEYKGFGKVIDVDLSGNSILIPLTVEGEFGGMWNMDVGAGGMGFQYPFAKEHGLLDRKGILTQGAGAGGSHENHSILCKTVEFGGFVVNDLVFSMPLDQPKGAFGSGEITGNVGNTLFEHFIMYVDYKNHKVILEKGDNFDKKMPRDNSGLGIRFIDGEYVVGFVSPGTPADKSGFKANDAIVKINGLPAKAFGGLAEIRELFDAEPGTEYKIVVNRDGTSKELIIKLKDLFL
ncbi:MAG: aspartyl protease family protein [Candidatus Zixiibacteriota bacterium]